jgi:hypothetical protein
MIACPCCRNKINKLHRFGDVPNKWTCVRNHIFTLELSEGQGTLVVEVSPDEACESGMRFPVPHGASFD